MQKKKKGKNKFEKDFEVIWESYPRKEGKLVANSRFKKLKQQGYTPKQIETAVFNYVDVVKDRERKYIKSGGRFFAESIYDYLDKKPKDLVLQVDKKKPNIKINDFEKEYKRIIGIMNGMQYSDYLNTDHWKHFKNQALVDSNFKCQLCNKKQTLLHVHHKTYENRGRETFNDIIVLCSECHRMVHKKE